MAGSSIVLATGRSGLWCVPAEGMRLEVNEGFNKQFLPALLQLDAILPPGPFPADVVL